MLLQAPACTARFGADFRALGEAGPSLFRCMRSDARATVVQPSNVHVTPFVASPEVQVLRSLRPGPCVMLEVLFSHDAGSDGVSETCHT